MNAKEFQPIFKTFCQFYNTASNETQMQIYFEEYDYLPAQAVEEIFKNAMKAEKGFGGLPTIQQIEPHKMAVLNKRQKHRQNEEFAKEPPIPGVVRASNGVFMRMIINAQGEMAKARKLSASNPQLAEAKKQKIVGEWTPAFAQFWQSRKKIEYESDCDEYWRIGWEAFKDTLDEIHADLFTAVMRLVNPPQESSADPVSPDDLPF